MIATCFWHCHVQYNQTKERNNYSLLWNQLQRKRGGTWGGEGEEEGTERGTREVDSAIYTCVCSACSFLSVSFLHASPAHHTCVSIADSHLFPLFFFFKINLFSRSHIISSLNFGFITPHFKLIHALIVLPTKVISWHNCLFFLTQILYVQNHIYNSLTLDGDHDLSIYTQTNVYIYLYIYIFSSHLPTFNGSHLWYLETSKNTEMLMAVHIFNVRRCNQLDGPTPEQPSAL